LERARGAIVRLRVRIQLLIHLQQVGQLEISHKDFDMILRAWMAPEAIKIHIPSFVSVDLSG
jgi:hypothetical protein